MIKCFDFECAKCGIVRKDVYLNEDEQPPKCPMCKQPMTKSIGGGNFVLKGGGWYSKGG